MALFVGVDCCCVADIPLRVIVSFAALTGSSATTPPTEAQKVSSNCHPVVPSSYELAFALNFNASCCDDSLWSKSLRGIGNDTNSHDESIIDFLEHQAVPILTKFAPADGNADSSDFPLSSMTTLSCLEAPVEAKNMANETNDPDGNESAAAIAVPYGSGAWMLGALVAAYAVFL